MREDNEYSGIHYYIEKKLQDISAIRQEAQVDRFIGNQFEAYLTFWQMVVRYGTISRMLYRNSNRLVKIHDDHINMADFVFHKIEIKIDKLIKNAKQEHLYIYLKRIFKKHKFDLILCDTEESVDLLEGITASCEIDCNIKVIGTTNKRTLARSIAKSDSIMVFCFAINVGSTILDYYAKVRRIAGKDKYVHCLSIMKRINMETSTLEASDNLWKNIRETVGGSDIYYYSGLPYYLYPEDSEKIKRLEVLGEGGIIHD